MSQQYDNRGRGVLFKNEDKRDDRDPDYRGNITLQDGTECWLDAWIATAKKDGRKFMSLRYRPKLAKDHAGAVAHKEPEPDFSDDIPFAWALLYPLGGLLLYGFHVTQILLRV